MPTVEQPAEAPVTELPDEPTPLAEEPTDTVAVFSDEETPLAEIPEDEVVELDDEETPLAGLPAEAAPSEELPDGGMVDVPETGDSAGVWGAMFSVSAAGLLGLTAWERKKRREEN